MIMESQEMDFTKQTLPLSGELLIEVFSRVKRHDERMIALGAGEIEEDFCLRIELCHPRRQCVLYCLRKPCEDAATVEFGSLLHTAFEYQMRSCVGVSDCQRRSGFLIVAIRQPEDHPILCRMVSDNRLMR